ncbi:MAG: hypothetical protein JSV88_10075 [Candidatus Aminicenantes bacterium]|nr:MAG: hypothetical protein JSV88_10075 [Candidatus Aminicenantes bacterium]
MSEMFKSPIFKKLGIYLDEFQQQTEYTLTNMQPKHKIAWNLKQLVLTEHILDRVFEIITNSKFSKFERNELKSILKYLFTVSLPYFLLGMDKNPIHHNLQVVENILYIAIGENKSYEFVKNAVILALLHDIGNGLVDPNLKKIKSSDIKNRIQTLKTERKAEDEIYKETKRLIEQARNFRNAHMKEGAIIAEKLLKEHTLDKQSLYGITISDENINKIKRCISIHDVPSIADYHAELGMKYGAEDLIPLNDILAVVLREADRLWMVSREGLEKDLFDDLKKDKQPDPLGKLQHNVKRFKEEYNLYVPVYRSNYEKLLGFKGKTLFRTDSGFQLLVYFVFERVKEILGKTYKVNVAVSLGGTKLGIALVFPGGIILEVVPPIDWRTTFRIDEQEKYADELKDRIAEKVKTVVDLIDKTLGQNKLGIIGISCKGPLSIVNGTKILGKGKKLTTLPFKNYPLEDKIKEALENRYLNRFFEVNLIHDGVAAILGEVSPGGTLKGKKDAAAVIIGSGVGIGIVKDGEIAHEELGSLGRYLVRIRENDEYHYEFITNNRKREPIRDLKNLPPEYKEKATSFRLSKQSLDHLRKEKISKKILQGLKKLANQEFTNEEEFLNAIKEQIGNEQTASNKSKILEYADKATHLSERIAGPWLAERLANDLKVKENRAFLQEIKKARDGNFNIGEVKAYLNSLKTSNPDKTTEKAILVNLTKAAKKKDSRAREFVISAAKEIGQAFAKFIYEYRKERFVEHIVLVSSVGENLGKGVTDEGIEDLFIHTIREQVKSSLEENDKDNKLYDAEKLASGIVRSDISVEREFFAFTPG